MQTPSPPLVQDNEEKCETDAPRDGEPVEMFEDRGDVFMKSRTGEQLGGRVLDVLQVRDVQKMGLRNVRGR